MDNYNNDSDNIGCGCLTSLVIAGIGAYIWDLLPVLAVLAVIGLAAGLIIFFTKLHSPDDIIGTSGDDHEGDSHDEEDWNE